MLSFELVNLEYQPNAEDLTSSDDDNGYGEYAKEHTTAMHCAWKACLEALTQAQETQKEQHDKTAVSPDLTVGQIVTMKRFKPAPNPKFANHWSGLFRIIELDEQSHAKIQSLYNPKVEPKRVHIDQIKRYVRPCGEPAMTDGQFDVGKHIKSSPP